MNFAALQSRRVDTHHLAQGSATAVGGEVETRYSTAPLPIDFVLPDDEADTDTGSAISDELPTIVIAVPCGDRGMEMLAASALFAALFSVCVATVNHIFNLGLFS